MIKLMMLLLILLTAGCASSVEKMRDARFTTGCAVVNADLKLGYFNQEGNAEACKLVCSQDLPKGFNYAYESRGCKVEIKYSE